MKRCSSALAVSHRLPRWPLPARPRTHRGRLAQPRQAACSTALPLRRRRQQRNRLAALAPSPSAAAASAWSTQCCGRHCK